MNIVWFIIGAAAGIVGSIIAACIKIEKECGSEADAADARDRRNEKTIENN